MALSRFINPTFSGESSSVSASFFGSLLVLWFISSGNYISLTTNALGQRSNFGNTELLNWKIFRSRLSKGFFFLLFVSFMKKALFDIVSVRFHNKNVISPRRKLFLLIFRLVTRPLMINRLRLSSQKSAKVKSFLPIINYLKKKAM